KKNQNLWMLLAVAPNAQPVEHEVQLGAWKLVAAHNAPVPAPQAPVAV
ncbi:hypothetical protein A2U01_0112039, partial [Trifolium medium]|nr:hypothetical protein [Trifolium medium]